MNRYSLIIMTCYLSFHFKGRAWALMSWHAGTSNKDVTLFEGYGDCFTLTKYLKTSTKRSPQRVFQYGTEAYYDWSFLDIFSNAVKKIAKKIQKSPLIDYAPGENKSRTIKVKRYCECLVYHW